MDVNTDFADSALTETIAALIVCESKLVDADSKKTNHQFSRNIKHKLLSTYGSFRAIIGLALEGGALPPTINTLLRNQYKQLDRWIDKAEAYTQHQINLLPLTSEQYPSLLKTIDDAPLLLYLKGNDVLLHQPQIGIVGSRQLTINGKKNAFEFARCLAKSGFVVTSGMANGIDTQAHLGALHTQGHTIAILGSGLLNPYPKNNINLMLDIVGNGGLIISEYQPNTSPIPAYFPQRNRIISGLSMGVLVVEASVRSGSLITARLAMEQGREVFAIPGSIHSPVSKGSHQLIRNGAVLVEHTEHIVEHLSPLLERCHNELTNLKLNSSQSTNIKKPDNVVVVKQPMNSLTTVQHQLLKLMDFETHTFEELLVASNYSSSQLSIMLTELELQGVIENTEFGYNQIGNK